MDTIKEVFLCLPNDHVSGFKSTSVCSNLLQNVDRTASNKLWALLHCLECCCLHCVHRAQASWATRRSPLRLEQNSWPWLSSPFGRLIVLDFTYSSILCSSPVYHSIGLPYTCCYSPVVPFILRITVWFRYYCIWYMICTVLLHHISPHHQWSSHKAQ